jgi:DNA-binding NtrC family response regulator
MSRRKLSILVVDDDEGAIHLLRRQIEVIPDWDVEFLAFTTGREALEPLRRRQVDVVFLDYLLDNANGLAVLRPILQTGNARAVIMLTGHGNEEIAAEAIKAGAEDYLVKDHLVPQRLRHAVLNALEKADLRRTVAEQQQALIEAEQQRVMTESLRAACHHFAQPLTAMTLNLRSLMDTKQVRGTREEALFNRCVEATERLANVLQHMRDVRQYRTEPYLSDTNILDIGIQSGHADRE